MKTLKSLQTYLTFSGLQYLATPSSHGYMGDNPETDGRIQWETEIVRQLLQDAMETTLTPPIMAGIV